MHSQRKIDYQQEQGLVEDSLMFRGMEYDAMNFCPSNIDLFIGPFQSQGSNDYNQSLSCFSKIQMVDLDDLDERTPRPSTQFDLTLQKAIELRSSQEKKLKKIVRSFKRKFRKENKKRLCRRSQSPFVTKCKV